MVAKLLVKIGIQVKNDFPYSEQSQKLYDSVM